MIDALEGWGGDLKKLSVRAWRDDSNIAAMVIVQGGEAAGWINLRLVKPQLARFVWLWIRHAAMFRAPGDVLHADDMAALTLPGDQRTQEA